MPWLFLVLVLGCGRSEEPVPAPSPIALDWVEANGLSDVTLGPDAPDVALIIIDTWRYDGPARRLAGWGRSGRAYTQAVAPSSWTLPSMAATLAGRELRANHQRIPNDWRLLPEVFQEAGYATHAVVANAVMAKDSGAARGFDTYELSGPESWDAREVVRRADAVLATPKTKPRFLYLHFMDPHLPYSGREVDGRAGWSMDAGDSIAWDGMEHRLCIERWRRRYDADVELVDAVLSEWLGRAELPIVALTSDHGEGLFTRAVDPLLADVPPVVPGCGREMLPGYADHGRQRFEEAIRVPLWVHAPGVTGLERRQVRTIDLARTLLALAGGAVDGPTIPLRDDQPAAPAAMGVDKGGKYVRVEGHKLIHQNRGHESLVAVSDATPFTTAKTEAQEVDDPAMKAAMSALLGRWSTAAGPEEPAWPETKEALKALGYIE